MRTKESFFDLLHDRFQAFKQKGGLLRSLREKAWDHFLELGLPDKEQESFRYVPLNSLYQTSFDEKLLKLRELETYIYPECIDSCIVLVDGKFSCSLSRLKALPKSIVILTLEEAMRTYGGFLQNRWHRQLREEDDSLSVLNIALHDGGLFVYVPPHIICETPIQILHLTTKNMTFPKSHIFVGSKSEIKFVWTPVMEDEGSSLMSSSIDLVVEEGAHVDCINLFLPSAEAWEFDSFRATLKKESSLRVITLSQGSKSVRTDQRVALIGENSEADFSGLSFLSGARQNHSYVLVDHQSPNTRSQQLFKGIVSDNSQSSFEGNIVVKKEAQKTQAYQLNKNLLIGEHAIAQSKPRLEIFADDVKASHGSTVSSIDPAQAFYLHTRGISSINANRLLLSGFCREITERLFVPSLRNIHFATQKSIFGPI